VKNRPSSDDIKNWEAKKTDSVCVELAFENPITRVEETVSKERKGSTSSYTLSTLPEPLSVVGRDVPIEVSRLINFSDLNFKGQHDDYLLKMTPGAVAKMINDLVGLSIIDVSLKNLNSQTISLKRDCDRLIGDIKTKDEEIAGMTYLDKMGDDIEIIESLQSDFESNINKKSQLTRAISDIDLLQENIEKNKSILKMADPAGEINDLLLNLKDKKTKHFDLKMSVSFVDELQSSLNDEKKWLEAKRPAQEINDSLTNWEDKCANFVSLSVLVQNIEKVSSNLEIEKQWLEAKPICQEVIELVSRFSIVSKEKAGIEGLISSYQKIEEAKKKTISEVAGATKNLEAFLKVQKICPTCGQPLSKIVISMMAGRDRETK